MTSSVPQSCHLTAEQQLQIAKYIENEMKEKYMQQTRTLEQLQLQMKQELLDKQAQLMAQLHTLDTVQPAVTLSNGSTSPITSTPALAGSSTYTSAGTSITALNGTPKTVVVTPHSATPPTSTVLTKSAATNGHSPFYNGVNGHMVGRNETVTGGMTSSFSADESINGSTSQGSSHDTWDSTNAFTHERPVLTGSERSTPVASAAPTATVLPSMDIGNDLELMSQSVHIPVDTKEAENQADSLHSRLSHSSSVSQLQAQHPESTQLSNGRKNSSEPASNDLIDLDERSANSSAAAIDDSTPRNSAVVSYTAHSVFIALLIIIFVVGISIFVWRVIYTGIVRIFFVLDYALNKKLSSIVLVVILLFHNGLKLLNLLQFYLKIKDLVFYIGKIADCAVCCNPCNIIKQT